MREYLRVTFSDIRLCLKNREYFWYNPDDNVCDIYFNFLGGSIDFYCHNTTKVPHQNHPKH